MSNKPKKQTVRLTIDLDAAEHRGLKDFALHRADNAKLADVVRTLIGLNNHDPVLADRVALEIYRRRGASAA